MSWWPWSRPGPVGGRPLPLDREEHVDRIVARGVYRVAVTAVVSILVISLTNSLLQGEILRLFTENAPDADPVQFADESISVLGNIASAGVGALAGWWSRGMLERATVAPAMEEDDE